MLARLRTLRVRDAGAPGPEGAFEPIGHLPGPPRPDEQFPDPLVGALADGLNADRLVRLELPAARLTSAGRSALVRRFGARVALV